MAERQETQGQAHARRHGNHEAAGRAAHACSPEQSF